MCIRDSKDTMPRENFLDTKAYDECYPDNDIHSMFVGEVVAVYGS